MEKQSQFKRAVNLFSKKENLTLLIVFMFFWISIYQRGFKFDGPNSISEKSVLLSGFIALFPTGVVIAIITFALSFRTSNWLKPMIELIILVARADGSISEIEKKAIEKNLNKQLGYLRIKRAIKYFYKLENSQELSISSSCRKLKEHFETTEMTVFLDFLVSVAVSDQYLSDSEEQLLNEICNRLGIHSKSLNSILSRKRFISENQRRKQASPKVRYSSLTKSYKILGLEDTVSFNEVKKAYRELAKQYHPDKIRNKDLKEQAKKQFQLITEAYDVIKKKRG